MNDILISALIQEIAPVVISLIVAWLAWLVRSYLSSLGDEKKLAAIRQVASAAIDYAEDLDKRGDLEKILGRLGLAEEVVNHPSAGIKKLHVAGKWVEGELQRFGIGLSEEEAQQWIAAEFQKRLAGLKMNPAQLVQLPGVMNQLPELDPAKLAGPLPVGPMGPAPVQPGLIVPAQLQPAEPFAEPESPAVAPISVSEAEQNELANLAQQAVDYVAALKTTRELTVPDIDIATAWMLTEVTKRGLEVTPAQIAREIHKVFGNIETEY
jgi:hypothetical protein